MEQVDAQIFELDPLQKTNKIGSRSSTKFNSTVQFVSLSEFHTESIRVVQKRAIMNFYINNNAEGTYKTHMGQCTCLGPLLCKCTDSAAQQVRILVAEVHCYPKLDR